MANETLLLTDTLQEVSANQIVDQGDEWVPEGINVSS